MSEGRWALPETWAWVRSADIAKIVGGGTPRADDERNFSENGIKWITPADLTGYGDVYISGGRRDLSESGLSTSGATLLPKGTVLFSSRAPVGYCAIAANEMSTNQGFKSLVLEDEILPEYVRHYLLSAKEYAESLASGTTFLELSGKRMAELQIPLAPVPEQKRIVFKLDSLSARTSTARTHLNAITKLVERYRQSVIDTTFALFELTVPLIDLVDSDTGIPYGIVQTGDHQEDGVPTVRAGDIKGFRLLEEGLKRVRPDVAEQYRRTKLKGGEVLIAIRGSVGETCVVPGTMAGNNISREVALIPVTEDTNASFIMYFLRSAQAAQYIKANIKGVAQTGINLRDLKRLQCPDLDKHTQAETVRLIESAFAKVDRLASEAEKVLKLTDRLEERILAKAFAGELVPQDPNDEPASELLERIREARANAPQNTRPRRTKATAMNKDPKDLLLADSAKWPANGVTSEELAKRVVMPHADLRDALFELLGGAKPQLEQVFDKAEERMRLKRVAQ